MRSPHKVAHATCPFSAASWADCDLASAHQWGKCRWLVGDKDPEQCSRWAGPEGTCSQHFASEIESTAKAARIAIARADRDARIDAYIAWIAEHPSVHDHMDGRPLAMSADSTRGLEGVAAGGGLEPPASRVTADRSTAELPRKKGPHRLTSSD